MPSQPALSASTCLPVRAPCTTSAHNDRPWPPWWPCGGKGSDRIEGHASCRPGGGSGCTRASSPWSLGTTRWLVRVAADATPRGRRPGKRGERPLTGLLSPSGWPPRSWWSGKRGRLTESTPCSARRRLSKGVTALCRTCLTSIVACPSVAPRYGRCGITSMVAPQTGRRPPRGFSDDRFRTSLQPCYRQSMTCHGLGNDIRPWRSLVDAIRCPALSGCPKKACTSNRVTNPKSRRSCDSPRIRSQKHSRATLSRTWRGMSWPHFSRQWWAISSGTWIVTSIRSSSLPCRHNYPRLSAIDLL